MAQIPVYQEGSIGTPRASAAKQQVSASPAAFGAIEGATFQQLGSQVVSLGSALANRANQIQKEKDSTAALDAFSKANSKSSAILYHPEDGIMNRQGQNALGSFKQSDEAFNKILNDGLGDLQNDDQKGAFKRLWDRKKVAMQDSIARHEASEFQQWRKTTANTLAEQAVNQGVLAAGDPEILQQSMEQIKIAVYASYTGESEETKNNIINGYENVLHSGVIERLSKTDYKQAQTYFDTFSDSLTPKSRARAEATLDTQKLKQETLVKSDEIWFSDATLSDKISQADQIKDNKLRKNVKASLRARQSDQKRIEAEQHDVMVKTTTEQIKNAGSYSAGIAIADNLDTDQDIERFRRFSNVLYGGATMQPKISNPDKVEESRKLIDSGDLTDESDFIYQYSPHLSSSDLTKGRDRLLKGGNKGLLSNSSMKTIYETLSGVLATDNTAEFNAVVDYVESNLVPGTDPTNKAVRDLTATALTGGGTKDAGFAWFDSSDKYYEAVREGTADTWLPDLSSPEEAKYESVLGDAGIEVTTDNTKIAKKLDLFSVPVTSKNIGIYKATYGVIK